MPRVALWLVRFVLLKALRARAQHVLAPFSPGFCGGEGSQSSEMADARVTTLLFKKSQPLRPRPLQERALVSTQVAQTNTALAASRRAGVRSFPRSYCEPVFRLITVPAPSSPALTPPQKPGEKGAGVGCVDTNARRGRGGNASGYRPRPTF